MSETLKRLFGPTNVGNGTNTIFTGAGSPHIYTIKHITVINNTAAAITVKVGIGGVADANLIIQPISVPPNGGSYEWDGMHVMNDAETLQTNATATGCTITGSGLDQV
jgi:hypothetical protein